MKKFFDYLNKRRLEIAKPFIFGPILDIGCGPATTYNFVKPRIYVGIERNGEFIKKLKDKFPLAKFYSRDLEKDKFNLDKKFDTILLLAVIEHIKNPDILFKELKRHLNKRGKIIITTPTPFGNFIHTLLSVIGVTSKIAVKEHVNIYSYKKMFYSARRYGFKIFKYNKFEFLCNSLFILELE